jgi:hypothetical protein
VCVCACACVCVWTWEIQGQTLGTPIPCSSCLTNSLCAVTGQSHKTCHQTDKRDRAVTEGHLEIWTKTGRHDLGGEVFLGDMDLEGELRDRH